MRRLFSRRPRCRYLRCTRRATYYVRWSRHPSTSDVFCAAHAGLLLAQGNPCEPIAVLTFEERMAHFRAYVRECGARWHLP